MGTWGLPPSHGTATSLLLPTLCFQHFPPKKGWPQPVARCMGAGGRALPGGATRGQRGPFGALTRSLCLSLPPRCVFRSARAASKRGPRWAAARRGVPTPTTTRVPSTQVSPPAAGTGGGHVGTPPQHPLSRLKLGTGWAGGSPWRMARCLVSRILWFVSRIWLLSAQIFVEMVARRGLRPCCCSGTPS